MTAPGHFEPTTHPYVGTTRTYMAPGTSPYEPDWSGSDMILPNGDAVTVESAWTRPYLPADAPILFYVRSHYTGKATHVTAEDLVLA